MLGAGLSRDAERRGVEGALDGVGDLRRGTRLFGVGRDVGVAGGLGGGATFFRSLVRTPPGETPGDKRG